MINIEFDFVTKGDNGSPFLAHDSLRDIYARYNIDKLPGNIRSIRGTASLQLILQLGS